MKRRFAPAQYAAHLRAQRLRHLKRSVIFIHMVDLPPDAPVGAALPEPYHGPERPEQWTPYLCNLPGCDKPTGPLMAYCCAEHWAASLTPPTPPWADKEAAGLICSACGYRYVSPETWICGSCGADANEVPWPGGAA